MKFLNHIILFIVLGTSANAQHQFKGQIDNDHWQNEVYLSVIDDYRTLENINDEQIISKATTDEHGFFLFEGNQLEPTNKIYKIHVDNCSTVNQVSNHFEGHCEDSKAILFIAKRTDTITFPLSFDQQMFCDISSNNPKTSAFIKIDALKDDMSFAYSEFRSRANRALNNKKWFKKLQDYGEALDEPLAELYIYGFLSERSNQFHKYYLEDLKTNTYYDELLLRLQSKYPHSKYAKQFEAELASDQFIASPPPEKTAGFDWTTFLIVLLLISALINLWFVFSAKRRQKKQNENTIAQLTKQEQKVLALIRKDFSNKDIAAALFVSVSTIKTHINNIYKKLNVTSRDELKALFNK